MTASPIPPARTSHSRGLITLIVDTSDSIAQIGALARLNQALRDWGDEMRKDDHLRRVGQVAVVTFGHDGVRTVDGTGATMAEPVDPFVDVDRFRPGDLGASGYSPMLEAIERGIDIIYDGVRRLDRQNLLLAWRPVLCLISDGAPTDFSGRPTDRLPEVARRIRDEEAARNLVFFAIGVPGADDAALRTLAGTDGYYSLAQVNFMQALRLVSASANRVKTMAGRDSAAEIKQEFRQDVKDDAEAFDWLTGKER
jgi:uncharacterized protein YegL